MKFIPTEWFCKGTSARNLLPKPDIALNIFNLTRVILQKLSMTGTPRLPTHGLCTATPADALLARAPKSVPPWAVCIIVSVLCMATMKPDGRRPTSSRRNVSSLSKSFIFRWSQPRLLGYTYVKMMSPCLKIPKRDWLVYNLRTDIN